MIKKVDLKGKSIICNNEREVHDVYEGLVAQNCRWNWNNRNKRIRENITPPSFEEVVCRNGFPVKIISSHTGYISYVRVHMERYDYMASELLYYDTPEDKTEEDLFLGEMSTRDKERMEYWVKRFFCRVTMIRERYGNCYKKPLITCKECSFSDSKSSCKFIGMCNLGAKNKENDMKYLIDLVAKGKPTTPIDEAIEWLNTYKESVSDSKKGYFDTAIKALEEKKEQGEV